jgi:hypothetical protein
MWSRDSRAPIWLVGAVAVLSILASPLTLATQVTGPGALHPVPVWTNNTTGVHPPYDYGGDPMVYDSVDGCVILYEPVTGGGIYRGVAGGYTWSYCHGGWRNIPSSVRPSLGDFPAMAYDAQDHYVILFGGSIWNSSARVSAVSNVTWKFANGTWSMIATPLAPPVRSGASIAYDPAIGAVILFGGQGNQNKDWTDTWEFSHGAWLKVHAAHHPPDLYTGFTKEPNLVWDAADQILFLFMAGTTNTHGAYNNATWAFANGSWSRIVTSGPAPRARIGASLAYDPVLGKVVLFGGQIQRINNSGLTNATWTFSAGHWTRYSPVPSPPQLAYSAMCYDPKLAQVVLFSSVYTYQSEIGETWLLS